MRASWTALYGHLRERGLDRGRPRPCICRTTHGCVGQGRGAPKYQGGLRGLDTLRMKVADVALQGLLGHVAAAGCPTHASAPKSPSPPFLSCSLSTLCFQVTGTPPFQPPPFPALANSVPLHSITRAALPGHPTGWLWLRTRRQQACPPFFSVHEERMRFCLDSNNVHTPLTHHRGEHILRLIVRSTRGPIWPG